MGQTKAAEALVCSIFLNQFSNLFEDIGEDHIKHRHVLLVGNTGVGKTLLATTTVKSFGIAYINSNATPITSAGYIGDKVENILERLLHAADDDIEKAECGVVIIDEIDKKKSQNDSSGRDVSGTAVQQELLKLLEPSTIWIRKSSQSQPIPFRTNRLTVIMMGAFVGLD